LTEDFTTASQTVYKRCFQSDKNNGSGIKEKGDTIIGALLTGTGQKMNIYTVQKIGRVHATNFHLFLNI
jgi:hypothetical protein